MMRDRSYVKELLERAKAAGCKTLVFTVDLTVVGARYRDVRNGMAGRLSTFAKLRAAMAIVRPADTQQVSNVMKLCFAAGQNVVTLGGLTGLVQGTTSAAADILLSLERMRDIEDIDITGKTMIAQAGVPL